MGTAIAIVCALALPTSTVADGLPPDCNASLDVVGRLGIQRTYSVACYRTTSMDVLEAPAHASVTSVRMGYVGENEVYVDVRVDDDAPREDAFVLRAHGPGGDQDIPVHLRVVPLSENTAPWCSPLEVAQRTDGTGPAVVHLVGLTCHDEEYDPFTITGLGPGRLPDSPKAVDPYSPYSFYWYYQTAISNGTEMTGYYATDSFGARSETAPVSIMVGPDVDHPTLCWPGPSNDGLTIFSRPGRTRRFSVGCQDRDPDRYTIRLGTPPADGAITSVEQFTDVDYDGEFWAHADFTYDPFGDSTDEDSLTVTVDHPKARVDVPVRIVHRVAPENVAPSCGGDDGRGYQNNPRTFWMGCSDDDGDPVVIDAVTAPEHGTLTPFRFKDAPFGGSSFEFEYIPDHDFAGADSFVLRASDGISEQTYSVPVDIRPLFSLGGGVPMLPPGPAAATGQARALTPADQARIALKTRDVKLLRRNGDASVYAARRTYEKGVKAVRGTRALALTCAIRCRLDARVRGLGARWRIPSSRAPRAR